MKLTDASIKALKSRLNEYRVCDGNGLYLIVSQSGSKIWQQRYRFGGKERTVSLGAYPVVSLSEARDLNFQNKKLIGQGIDPCAEKRKRKEQISYNIANTFGVVAKEWFDAKKVDWTPRHQQKLWYRLNKYVLPYLGNRPISEIKAREIIDVIQRIESTGAIELSHCQLGVIKRVFRRACNTDRITYNPAAGLHDVLRKRRVIHHPMLRESEIPEFLNAFKALKGNDVQRIAFLLLLLTALRTSELRLSKWSDVDFEARELRVSADRMKMRETHLVPLSRQALALLRKLHGLTGHQEWLFPSSHGRNCAVINASFANEIIARLDYKGRVVGHGFRRMFSTIANGARNDGTLGRRFDGEVIEKQLAHEERNRVRGSYNAAEYWPERQVLMQWWADYITAASDSKFKIGRLLPKPAGNSQVLTSACRQSDTGNMVGLSAAANQN